MERGVISGWKEQVLGFFLPSSPQDLVVNIILFFLLLLPAPDISLHPPLWKNRWVTLIRKREKSQSALFTAHTSPTHPHQFSRDQLDWRARRPIIGYQQTIIRIIHPIVSRGRLLMMAPAKHEADMMGALERQLRVAMWQSRRMLEQVVNRPEMQMTNDQKRFLICVWLNKGSDLF